MGVLVAISIPIFTSQLEKSRDAVTAANVRVAYAEASAAKLTESNGSADVVYNADGTVTISNIVVKGQDTNGAFGKAAGADGSGAADGQFDLPFTLDSGAMSVLDKGTSVKLKFSWDANGACKAEKVA